MSDYTTRPKIYNLNLIQTSIYKKRPLAVARGLSVYDLSILEEQFYRQINTTNGIGSMAVYGESTGSVDKTAVSNPDKVQICCELQLIVTISFTRESPEPLTLL